MTARKPILVAVLLLCAVGLLSCSQQAPPPQSAAPAQTAAVPPATQSAPVATQAILASAQYSADPDLRCDLLEVKRVSGGALRIRWRIVNTAGGQQQTGLVAGPPKTIYYTFDWGGIYYIDPARKKKKKFP